MITKQQLIAAIAATTLAPKAQVERTLDELGSVIRSSLHGGDEVALPGVGKFKLRVSAARAGRNPRTGESVSIPSRTVAKFVAAKELKDLLQPKAKGKRK